MQETSYMPRAMAAQSDLTRSEILELSAWMGRGGDEEATEKERGGNCD